MVNSFPLHFIFKTITVTISDITFIPNEFCCN
uniref:Uncharacterized protein n=1 Tax=Rhizophora mucronata TaxID=61149 RepID=A0A2P2R434_RHIMU